MILRRFFDSGDRGGVELPPPEPERLTYLIGDVHGCRTALHALLDAVAEDAGEADADLVLLGDYIDRGPDSAGVLADLKMLCVQADNVTCLLGNHDRMLLDFLADPVDTAFWLRNGAEETLMSYGLTRRPLSPDEPYEDRLERVGRELAAVLGEDLREWLGSLPLWWRSGTLVAVHALTEPDMPMEEQSEETLLWARPDHRLKPRSDGAWVVHGHTVVPEPLVRAGHIAIDTGAMRGGPLTAAVVEPGVAPRFLDVPGYPD